MSWKDELLDLFGWVPAKGARPKPHSPATAAPADPVASPPAGGGRSEAEALAVVAVVAPQFRRIVYTRNRRIMASVAGQGRELRLNVAFARAEARLLEAVARLFTARDRRTRARARREVRGFLNTLPPDPRPPRRRPRPALPSDERHLERLRAEFRRANARWFAGELPEVPIHLSGRMRSRNGHFSTSPLEIVISRRLCSHALPGEAEETVRHEMIHLWQHVRGARPDHGREFREWARRLDVHPRASRVVRWKGRR